MKRLLFVFFIFSGIFLFSQQNDFVQNKLLIKTKYNIDNNLFNLYFKNIKNIEKLQSIDNFYILSFDNNISIEEMMFFNKIEFIKSIRFPIKLNSRSSFNDSLIDKQDYMNYTSTIGLDFPFGINAFNCFDKYPLNKTTINGDSIVIAVIEPSFDSLTHEDINYFKNYNEIANDNIDNDQNGYVDDFNGWNSINNSSEIVSNNFNENKHSSIISGLLVAIGNNNKGIVGVNYNAKILPIRGGQSEVDIYKSYDYLINLKKNYLKSNGKKGAYVIAINYSGGCNNCFPSQYPEWNQYIDSLASVGIMQVAATTNSYSDVEKNGDMPTLCSSENQIIVTFSNTNNQIDELSGVSTKFVDIAAPGYNYSTLPKNNYGFYSKGTSYSTPLVCGAYSLFFNLANKSFLDKFNTDPKVYSIILKNILLNTADTSFYLKNKSVSRGKLNILKAMDSFMAYQENIANIQNIETHKKYKITNTDEFIEINFLQKNMDFEIRLFDMASKQILYSKSDNNKFIIDKLLLRKGIFIIDLRVNNFEIGKEKISIY